MTIPGIVIGIVWFIGFILCLLFMYKLIGNDTDTRIDYVSMWVCAAAWFIFVPGFLLALSICLFFSRAHELLKKLTK